MLREKQIMPEHPIFSSPLLQIYLFLQKSLLDVTSEKSAQNPRVFVRIEVHLAVLTCLIEVFVCDNLSGSSPAC